MNPGFEFNLPPSNDPKNKIFEYLKNQDNDGVLLEMKKLVERNDSATLIKLANSNISPWQSTALSALRFV